MFLKEVFCAYLHLFDQNTEKTARFFPFTMKYFYHLKRNVFFISYCVSNVIYSNNVLSEWFTHKD